MPSGREDAGDTPGAVGGPTGAVLQSRKQGRKKVNMNLGTKGVPPQARS